MTPAVRKAEQARIPFRLHEYEHDPASESYGDEAAVKMGVDADRVFKTLVVSGGGRDLFVAVVPVSRQLDLKRFAKSVGAKKIAMAEKKEVERTTGYVLGGVSPLGQKRQFMTVIDRSALNFETIFVSAGRRGLEIELAPADLCSLTNGRFDSIGKC
ncbi:MAG: Cys-tRNA(Pro) deacylase [Desulfobacterales bacterium]